jgi:hypothetical protein
MLATHDDRPQRPRTLVYTAAKPGEVAEWLKALAC